MKNGHIIFLTIVVMAILACNKDLQTGPQLNESFQETHHGYLYIGCAGPPYYLNFDSLVIHCSAEGSLPDTFPDFDLNADFTQPDQTPEFCRFDGNEEWIGTQVNHDIKIEYQSSGILTDISSNWQEVTSEPIPINIENEVYEAGEGSYLGGFQYTTENEVVTIQVVNAYVGGCFHNVVIWSKQQ